MALALGAWSTIRTLHFWINDGLMAVLVFVVGLESGALVWFGALRARIHPTLAGVALGLLTLVRPWHDPPTFLRAARAAIEDFEPRTAAPGRAPTRTTSPACSTTSRPRTGAPCRP